MSKINYDFKSYVLREHEDLLKEYKRSSKYEYAMQVFNDYGVISKCLEFNDKYKPMSVLYEEVKDKGLLAEFNECKKIANANYKREERLRNRVKTMLLNGSCIFLTLTFTDEVLNNTDTKTRRVAVSRYLKTFNAPYIANIDFGSKNHREHYHALINCESVNRKGWLKYGSIDFERVRLREFDTDSKKITKYISKLSNHAIKETTKRSALMYSR